MQQRFSPTNQFLHWATVILMFTVLPLAWVMVNAKPTAAFTPSLFNWHKTLGAIVLLITAWRIVWRFIDPPPPYPPAVAGWERALAQATYWLFFAILIFMPVTGYLSTQFANHPPKLFDAIATPLLLSPDKSLGRLFTQLHLDGQWAVYALIVLHLSAVAYHLLFRHDGVLGRMLPADAAEPAAKGAPRPRPAPGYGAANPNAAR